MNTVSFFSSRASFWALCSSLALLLCGSPAFAQHAGGGFHGGGGGGGGFHGGGGGGGGFHGGAGAGGFHGGGGFSGGAGFRGGVGGFHAGGFSGARGPVGISHFGGYGAGRPSISAPRIGGYSVGRPGGFSGHAAYNGFATSHYAAPRGGYSGAIRGGFVNGHAAALNSYRPSHVPAFVGRPAYPGHPGYGYGWGRGGYGWSRPYWGGGYWRGCYWPRAYYGWAYPWFLGVLPGVYATYWWGGMPYYYVNNVYYTWNAGYGGYVVTDPPPADQNDTTSADYSGDYASAEPDSGSTSSNTGSAEVYAYPKEGQSEEQQSTDRYECHKWAVAQSGFDPTQGSQARGSRGDYRRAMTACLDGRGYSAQ